MRYLVLTTILFFPFVGICSADGGHHHAIPTLKKGKTTVAYEGDTITITFGPIDLPVGHSGDLAASMPKHFFSLPEDRHFVAFKSEVYTKDGTPLAPEYLHHLLLLDMDRKSISCEGEPMFLGGAGMEMVNTRFPKGYGVALPKGHKFMTLVAFYHGVPPTKDAMARFTIHLAPKDQPIQAMDVYQIGVNVVCFSKFAERPKNQSDEGIEIPHGVQVMKAERKFQVNGCVKFAYPHAHDGALLVALENLTTRRTLLRTVPDVKQSGKLIGFSDQQVFSDATGFSINTKDQYEMVLVHHRPLQQENDPHGMGNYLLYMTPGECPNSTNNQNASIGGQSPS